MDELDELVPEIKKKRCIVFIGAGVSKNAGCKDWDFIPEQLSQNKELKELLNAGIFNYSKTSRLPIQIEELRNKLIELEQFPHYERTLEDAIRVDSANRNYGKFKLLVEVLFSIFSYSKILVTTNVDDSLENTEFYDSDKHYRLKSQEKEIKAKEITHFRIRDLEKGGRYHIHGYEKALFDAAFTETAYKDRYSDWALENFICHLISNYTFLFIGYSFQDNEIQEMFKIMKNRKHYRLVQKDKNFAVQKTEFEKKYNIKLIGYPDHDDLPDLLRNWTIKHNISKKEDVTHAR